MRHPGEPGWGIGQVQSAIGDRVTVNFEHAGKRLINTAVVTLVPVDDDRAWQEIYARHLAAAVHPAAAPLRAAE